MVHLIIFVIVVFGTFKSGTKIKRVNLDAWHPVEFSSITLKIPYTHSTQLGR